MLPVKWLLGLQMWQFSQTSTTTLVTWLARSVQSVISLRAMSAFTEAAKFVKRNGLCLYDLGYSKITRFASDTRINSIQYRRKQVHTILYITIHVCNFCISSYSTHTIRQKYFIIYYFYIYRAWQDVISSNICSVYIPLYYKHLWCLVCDHLFHV